jgi:hypothetical protein
LKNAEFEAEFNHLKKLQKVHHKKYNQKCLQKKEFSDIQSFRLFWEFFGTFSTD